MTEAKAMQEQLKRYRPFPGCPTLAWFIKQRITDPVVELDCTILFRGKKGASKSTSSIGLCLGVAHELAREHNKPASYFFNIEDHVRTCDPNGTMEMFTTDIIRRENSVLLADDVSISADSRDAMSRRNKSLGKILNVSRIYRNMIVMNAVYSTHIDKKIRGLADIIIDMIGVDRKNKQALGKVYWYEVNQNTGKEYMKFFQWKGKHINMFLFDLPPDSIVKAYKKLRREKTNELLDDIDNIRIGRPAPKINDRDKKAQELFTQHFDTIKAMRLEGKSIKSIQRKTGLHEYWINKMIAQAGMD
jgi:hypothetical protein